MRLTFLVMAGLCAAAVAAPTAWGQVSGGWSKVSTTDKGVVQAAQFAVEKQQEIMKEAKSEEKLSLVKILSAQQQVVAGMNYRVELQVKVGEEEKKAEAVVWVRLWLKGDEKRKLTSWEFVKEEEKE